MVQALINLAVVLRLLPIAGVPLPLVSYGGSALIANLLALGVLLSCARHEPDARRLLEARKRKRSKRRVSAVVGSTTDSPHEWRGLRPGRPISVVLAGGGTAGHTSPLIATAQEIIRLAPDVRVTAVGTARGLETTVVPAAGLHAGADPAGAAAAPTGQGPAAGADPAGPGRRRGRAAAASGSRPTSCSASAGTCPRPSTWPPGGAGCRSSSTSRTRCPDWPTGSLPGSPTTSSRPSPTPRCRTPPASACRCGRSVTDLDRAGARGGARASFGLPADGQVLLVSGGSQGAASLNRAVLGGPRRPAGRRGLGAARGRTEEPHRRPRRGHRRGHRRGLPAAGLHRGDGRRVRRRRPDARPLWGEHRAGDGGRRDCPPCSCPTRTGTGNRRATPPASCRPAAACCWPTPTARRTGWPPRCPA